MLKGQNDVNRLYFGFGVLLAILLILAWVAAVNFSRLAEAHYWDTHTYEVLGETRGLGEGIINMDTGARGFAITGDKRFLQPLTKGQAEFSRYFKRAQSLTVDNPVQQQRLRQLDEQQQQWRRIYIEPLLTMRRATLKRAVTLEDISRIAARGKPYTDRMRAILGDMEQTEATLAARRAREVTARRSQTGITLTIGGAFSLLMLSGLGTSLARNTRQLAGNNAALEAEIAERRQAEEALQQAKAEAERANAAKSEFLSRMSHELRTPMNAILGFAQLLEMDELQPEQRDGVQHILKGGRHLLDLINEVLDISRVEAGQLSLSPEPVQVSAVVRQVCDLTRPLADEAHIEVQAQGCLPEASDPYVMADRQRLIQVLLNLVSNAIKYNRANGTVTISCKELPEARLRIEVADTGPGIAPDDISKLFVPFERLGAAQTTIEGTGLGLAFSRRLVEAMDGAIGVESTPGRGSTFWVELAVAASPVEQLETMTVEQRRLRNEDRRNEVKAHTMLYIEDNLSNLRLIERILTRHPQIRLLSAMQGSVGLDLAQQHQPDVILLDLHLPDIAGDRVLRQLRANPRTQDIPVVMLSADATPRQIERLLASGARAYLTKPLDVRVFLKVLKETVKD